MSNFRLTGNAPLMPRLLLALALVAVLCHVDNLMTVLQPLQEMEQSINDDLDDDEDKPQNEPLMRYIQARYKVPADTAQRLVNGAYAASKETGLSPTLILAVSARESSFDHLSDNGSDKGLMQVNPRWHPDRVAEVGDVSGLFDVKLGMLAGARILKQYAEATNYDLPRALSRYNGDSTNRYANGVLQEKRLFDQAVYRPGLKKRANCSSSTPGCYTPQGPLTHRGHIS